MPTSATPVQIVDDNGRQITSFGGTAGGSTSAKQDSEIAEVQGVRANQTNGNQQVQGNAASGATDAGNPIKAGGRVTTTGLTFANGQRADLQMDANGGVAMYLKVPGINIPLSAPAAPADGETAGAYGLTTYSRGQVFNDTSGGWDKARGNSTGAFVVSKGTASIATGQVAVTTSSTLVAAARPGRAKITLSPTSSTVYYVGNTGVSTTTGVYVAAGASITLDTSAAVYAVGSAALTVSYIEHF